MAHPTGTATASALALLWAASLPWPSRAETPAPGEAWRSSPFHGVPNAATGRNIPCVCVYRGKEYRLGEAVCMNTHLGTLVTRCDLSLNNTTWAPTTEPCTISMRTPHKAPQFACAPSAPITRPPA
jgi:hypothetical protein